MAFVRTDAKLSIVTRRPDGYTRLSDTWGTVMQSQVPCYMRWLLTSVVGTAVRPFRPIGT
jgi:hypothetical protein